LYEKAAHKILVKLAPGRAKRLKKTICVHDPNLPSRHPEPDPEHHLPKDLRQLSVGQRQGPQAKVGGRVGHCAQAELDGVNGLNPVL